MRNNWLPPRPGWGLGCGLIGSTTTGVLLVPQADNTAAPNPAPPKRINCRRLSLLSSMVDSLMCIQRCLQALYPISGKRWDVLMVGL